MHIGPETSLLLALLVGLAIGWALAQLRRPRPAHPGDAAQRADAATPAEHTHGTERASPAPAPTLLRDDHAALLQAVSDGVLLLDATLTVLHANAAAEQIFGQAPGGLAGTALASLVEWPLQPLQQAAAHRSTEALAGFERGRGELRAHRVDGAPLELEAVVRVLDRAPDIAPAEPGPTLMLCVRDVGALRLAERALADSQLHFRSVVENLNEIVFRADADACWTYLNPAWTEVTQFPVEASLGQPVFALSPPEDLPALQTFYAPLLDGREDACRGEFRYLARDGSVRWVDVYTRALRDANGTLTGFAGSAQDVTERRLADERLRNQLGFVQQMLEVIPNPIYIKDHEGRYIGFNKAWADFFGYDRAQWLGKTVLEVFPGPYGQGVHDLDLQLLRNPGTQSYESWMTDAHGTTHEILSNKATFRNADGSVGGLIGVVTDMTQRKSFEHQLLEAKSAAERAARIKSEFLANMSHEIRTPMNAIIGMTQLALDTALDDEQREYLEIVRTSGDALLHLINDILDFSKIEAGKLSFESVQFGLADVVRDVVRMFGLRARDKGVELTWRVPPEAPVVVSGDPGRLRQVLINLVGNALKFTERGSVSVTISAVDVEGETLNALFAIHDTGVGIPEDKQALIFEAFSQADSSVTRRFGGTGLGLTICARLVEGMGGAIWVDSKPGEGSTFFFTVRLGVAPGAAQSPTRADDAAPRGTVATVAADVASGAGVGPAAGERDPADCGAAPGVGARATVTGEAAAAHAGSASALLAEQEALGSDRPLHVLLAEDQPVNQMLAVRVLEKMGHRVRVADNGALAVAALREETFDVVLMDVQMPVMDGFEATRQLRALQAEGVVPPVPVVAMTAHALAGDRERCIEAGMDDYLTKPIRRDALRETLRRIAGARGVVAPAVPDAQPAPAGVPELDLSRLLETFEGDLDAVDGIVKMFAGQCPGDVQRIADAHARDDRKGVRESLHRLKGTAASVGAEQLYALCAALEHEAAAAALAPRRLEALQHAGVAVVAAARRHLQRDPAVAPVQAAEAAPAA